MDELCSSKLRSQTSSDISASESFAGLVIDQMSAQQLEYIQSMEVAAGQISAAVAGHILAVAVAGHISAVVAALCIVAAVAAVVPSKSDH